MTKFGIAALLLMATLGLLGAIGGLTTDAEQRAKDEWMRDLPRQLIETCKRETFGSPNYPGICALEERFDHDDPRPAKIREQLKRP